jgi:hypothetical protein
VSDLEAIPGLPHELPPGEKLLWQGRPEWRALARSTFKARWLAGYLGVFATLRLCDGLYHGEGAAAVQAFAIFIGLSAVCLGIVALLAWGYARATLYSITSERVVMRIGVAIPLTVNLPFRRIGSADLKRDGEVGDIVLQLATNDRIAWLHLWPHAQTRHVSKPRPTLLSLPRSQEVAALLGHAVEAWATKHGGGVMLGLPAEQETMAPPPVSPGQLLGASH